MRKLLLLAFCALLGSTVQPAIAGGVIDVATSSGVGCRSRQDMLDLMSAGTVEGTDIAEAAIKAKAAAQAKIRSGKCFAFSSGQGAFTDITWQNPRDLWSGIMILATKSGHRFYSTGWLWVYVKDVFNPIP